MARVAINTGASANDGLGDNLRAAGGILNSNFLELYTYLGAGSTTTLSAPVWSTTNAGINTLRNVGIGTTNPRFALEVGAVGASGTTLFVNGDARVTGIVTIGPASITLNGVTNIINVGTGITINGSTGIISATAIVLGGTTLTGSAVTSITAGSGISVNQSTGNVTITATGTGSTSQWVTTAAGIHTLSNVGIGTTNPTSALTVTGNGTFTGVVTATTFVGALTGTATTATNAQGLTGTPNITVGVTTASRLNVGTSGTVITTTTAGLVGIGTTNPTKKLTVSDDALINGLTVGLGGSAVTSNTAIGASALYSNTGGVNNTANGYAALYSNTNGDGNTATGYNALLTNTTGDFNTANGAGTLSVNTGEKNTATGYGALNANTTGNFNTAIGVIALGTITTGTNNTGIGASAGIAITTGSKNTLLGSYTGNQNGLDIRTSSNNVVLSDGDGNIRFYANSSGNVGLGATNPTSKLTVVGASGTTLLVTGGTIPIQIGGNDVSGTIFKVGQINLSGPDASDVNATYYSNILYQKVGDFRYDLEFHSGGYTGYGGAAPAGGPGDFIFYKRDTGYGRAERFRISGETGDITSQGGVIAASTNVSGVATASRLNVGTSGTVITTTTAGLVGIGTTNPTSALTVGAVGSATTNLVVNGFAKIDQIVIKNNSNNYQDNIIMTQHPAVTFTGNRNVAIGDYSFATPGAAGENVAIGYYALSKVGNNNTSSTYNGNTAVGSWSGENATTTLRNTFIGWEAGKYITSGSENVILGSYNGNQNGLDIRTSSNNVVLSDGAGNIRFYANSSGNVGLGTTNPTEKLTVVGVTSSTSFYGDASYTASGRWTLGANGSSDYTFVGIGFTQTTNDPVLYLARGRVYEFVNNSGGSHPFQIRVSNGGAAYSDGVTNNGGASGVIRFEIPFNAPNTLYYQCTVHSGMGNTISVYPNTI
jgi:hypothetical protein